MVQRNLRVVSIVIIVSLAFVISCQNDSSKVGGTPIDRSAVEENDDSDDAITDIPVGDNDDNTDSDLDTSPFDWKDYELKDVRSGEFYKVNDFRGKPVLVESFAVWCPTCTRQQKILKEFHEEVGDSVVSIALDTDPNEDESKVLEHIESNGFDWYYSVSPIQLTQDLIDMYGFRIVNAPSVPMILVCEDGSERLLDTGIKTIEELKEEISKGC
ncbi:hypothetical protein BVX95_00840 [archaeon D22]|nr:hypothetical protein BVX95_00840 [archaeon D22]